MNRIALASVFVSVNSIAPVWAWVSVESIVQPRSISPARNLWASHLGSFNSSLV